MINEMKGGVVERNKVLWVKTITDPCRIGLSVMLIVEDENRDAIVLDLIDFLDQDVQLL